MQNNVLHLTSYTSCLTSSSGFRRYFTNTSWLFAEKVLRMAVGLFVGVWVARYLGPSQYGLLSYTQAFVGLFTAFATLGLDGIVVRELVRDEGKRDELLATAFWLKFIGAIVMIGFIAIAVQFTSNDYYTNILVFIVASATIFQAFNVIDFYFQAKVLGKYIALANSTCLFLSSIVKIALILYKAPLIVFVWAVVFDSVILALGYLYFYLKLSPANHLSPITHHPSPITFPLSHFTFNKSMVISLLKDSWPLILSGLAVMIYMRIDQVMLQEMMGSEAVGQYSAAVRISEAWYFIPLVISSSLFPAIINAKKQSEELYYARFQRLYDLMVWISLAIALPMTFLSGWVINLLYGSAYNQAGSVLMIHIWTGVFVSLGVASGKWFLAENLQTLSFWRTFYGMVINVILNLILISKYGVQGAAVATLFANFTAAFLFDFFNTRTRKVFFMKLIAFNPIKGKN
ncbi:MAG TPA: flippase [Deltaproteobacteria bacterium]|nr:flippase [Deltaproteobacteria bacterium]